MGTQNKILDPYDQFLGKQMVTHNKTLPINLNMTQRNDKKSNFYSKISDINQENEIDESNINCDENLIYKIKQVKNNDTVEQLRKTKIVSEVNNNNINHNVPLDNIQNQENYSEYFQENQNEKKSRNHYKYVNNINGNNEESRLYNMQKGETIILDKERVKNTKFYENENVTYEVPQIENDNANQYVYYVEKEQLQQNTSLGSRVLQATIAKITKWINQ